jgi:lysozyme family protein
MTINDPNFSYCVQVVLEDEGGLVNDPNDPGGLTNFGISQASYPSLDIANLTEDQAAQIYYDDYWVPFNCGKLPVHLDLWFMTACVMSGGETATKILQQLAGVTSDGIFGPLTEKAVAGLPATSQHEYLTLYAQHLMGLSDWSSFAKGWLNRLFRVAAL